MTQPDGCETQWRAQEKAVAVAESITFAAYLKLNCCLRLLLTVT